VKGLTLWLFGGIANLGGQPPTPQADLRIAAVGPATSLALGAGFGVVGAGLAAAGAGDLVVAVAAWLAFVNVVLAVFNLVPGAPLDGGRVLRALLWRRHGDWARAAVSAARAGKVVGYVLMWLGLVELLAGAGIGGLWLAFVGWFVLGASRAEQSDVTARNVLRGVRVRDVMTRDPRVAPGWITVGDLVEHYLLGHPHSGYPVKHPDGHIMGLVTLRQLRAVALQDRSATLVADVALPLDRLPTAAPGEPMVDVLERLDSSIGGRILVFDGKQLAGIVTPTDVTRAIDVRNLQHQPTPGPNPSPNNTAGDAPR
jgi:CBS domain-containing protein